MIDANSREFPDAVTEITATAQGAGVPPEDLMLLNFWVDALALMRTDPEVAAFLARTRQRPGCAANCSCPPAAAGRGCTDVAVVLGGVSAGGGGTRVLLGHNDDNSADIRNRTYSVLYSMVESNAPAATSAPPAPTAWASAYAGELLAPVYNSTSGLYSTANYLTDASPQLPGVARAFIDNSLLAAASLPDFVRLAGRRGRAVGHSYNLVDLGGWRGGRAARHPSQAAGAQGAGARYINVEAGPGGVVSVAEVSGGWYVHTNVYKHLAVRQVLEDSSLHREVRALELAAAQPPTGPSILRTILGDTEGASFAPGRHPIYRGGPGDAGVGCDSAHPPLETLETKLLDSDAGRVYCYAGNPKQDGSLQFTVKLSTLEVVDALAPTTQPK